MSSVRMHLRNLVTSWGNRVSRVAVLFFLAPFMVHTLGDIRYGIWSLIISVVGYMGIGDIGLRRSVSKHLNQYLATNDEHRAVQVVSTSLLLLAVISVAIMMMSYFVGGEFNRIFSGISHEYLLEIRIALMLAAVELSVRLMGSVFRRSIEAFNRFDLVNVIEFGHMIIRTAGIVGVLILSPSLIGLAAVSLLSTVVDVFAIVFLSRRIWPGLRVSVSLCSKELMREMAGFGIPAFIDNVSRKIIDKIALIIIGALLSVQLVTMYSIGLMVTNYAWILLIQIVTILTPEIYKVTARGDDSATRYLYFRTSNANAFLCIPVLISCIFFAEDFMRLWMGQEYLESARIMQILSISTLFMVWSYPAGTVILGYGHARLAAVITAIEAAVTLILSIVFLKVLNMGIIGAAIGTLIPVVILEGICRPMFACRMMQLSIEQFLFKAGMRWYLVAGLFSGMCLLGKTVSITAWLDFIMVIGGLCIIYSPIGWFLLFDNRARRSLLQPLRGQVHAK